MCSPPWTPLPPPLGLFFNSKGKPFTVISLSLSLSFPFLQNDFDSMDEDNNPERQGSKVDGILVLE